MYNGRYAMDLAMKKADEVGMAIVTVKDSGHFGARSCYSVCAAEKGYLAIAMSNINKLMCVPGGKGNIVGNVPISYAIPRQGQHPIFMDIALSQVAKLKVVQYQKEGKKVPDGCVVRANGNYRMTQQPFDGHKLSGIGSEGIMYTLQEMVKVKTIVLKNVF